MCGTRTETVTVLALVDDSGGRLSVPDEVTGGNNYRVCVAGDLRARCTPSNIEAFSTTGTTLVANCCSQNVVDGMGVNTATNQCRIGDGCAPITVPGTTTLMNIGQMITCTCSGMNAMAPVPNLVEFPGTPIAMLSMTQSDNAEGYRTCLETSLSSLCTSSGFATFTMMGTTAGGTCCINAPPVGAGGMVFSLAPNQECAIGA